jgi:hypothetical protein
LKQALSDWTFWSFVICGSLGVGIIIFVRIYSGSKRARQYRAFAAASGFAELKSFPNWKAASATLPLLRRGHSRRCRNIYERRQPGLSTIICDCQYTFGLWGIAGTRYAQTIFVLESEQFDFPEFSLAPASGLERAMPIFAGSTVEINSRGDFNRRYVLKGPDILRIQTLFTPAVVQLLEGEKWGFTLNASSSRLLVAWHNILPAGTFFLPCLESAKMVADALVPSMARTPQ